MVIKMSKNIRIKSDPFWEENSRLSIKEIEQKFPEKIAEALKQQKKINKLIGK